MFFTLYYMYATFLQWWKLGVLKNKLNGTLNSNNALLVCDESVIFDTKKTKSIENLLFRRENRIGVTIVPKQTINLSSQWLYFPRDSRYFPIFFSNFLRRNTISSPNIYIIIQAVLDIYKKHESEILELENFGELIAWKLTDHFEAILKTDMDKLSKLVHCFTQNNCDINHELQLLKIETVEIDGIAKRIIYERQYSIETTQKYSLAPIHWQIFVKDVKDLYAKIRDTTKVSSPKITIDNGTPAKPDEVKIVPISQVKPIKKDRKSSSEEKHTLDVNCSDYRRHGRTREHRRHKTISKEEDENEEHEIGVNNDEAIEQIEEKKDKKISVHHKHKRHEDKSHHESTSAERELRKKTTSRTSSKEKKLTRASATCSDEPHHHYHRHHHEDNEDNDEEIINSPTDELIDRKTLLNVKPPNILVYSDSMVAKENVKQVLNIILNREKYTIYDFPTTDTLTWRDSTILVIVCGNVDSKLTFNLMKYLLNGGQLLCLCSDLLYCILHTFTTAEVREHELVRFSYGKWKNVKMMHHVFCYQASPAKKQFSKDSDNGSSSSSPVAPKTPSTVEIEHEGKTYLIQVQVLGAEETWQTPSLLLASVKGAQGGGKAIFSQVHLEIDPNEYIEDENKFEVLTESDPARLEIFRDLLSNYLQLDCDNSREIPALTPAYFLGRHDLKVAMLNETPCIKNNEMKAADLNVQFCGKDVRYNESTRTFLPVLIHACPQNFNTVSYFETLDTKFVGRLVIYSDVLTSSQNVLKSCQLTHGVAVICRQQIEGIGRSGNKWISPEGSALFSLQLQISLQTNLGKSQGLVQHIIMVAVVKAIQKLTDNHHEINVAIKWPNDLYINKSIKIGGAMVTSTVLGDLSTINIGCGVNLSNNIPTTSINNAIIEVNARNGIQLPEISHEKYFAQVFNETETLINRYQSGDSAYFFDAYYQNWLHNKAEIKVTTKDGKTHKVKIDGIDDQGYLKVRTSKGKVESVQPDGNSFDMMKGLIFPKFF